MKNVFFKGFALCLPFIFASCNETNEFMNGEEEMQVLFSVDEFINSSSTRTNVDPSNNFAITWASGDVIGIFPREGYQEPFAIPANQVGNSKATFDGGYWALKNGLTYNAYYPFDKANFDSEAMKTKIPVTYFGQEQTGVTCCIGAFDYTYSDWTEATGGTVNFKFHHIGAFAIFSLEYPATTTYTKLTLSANSNAIPIEGTYDLTAQNVVFVADDTKLSNSITLSLNNCLGTAGEKGTFYMMLPPMDLSTSELLLTLTSAAGTECTYSLESLNIEAATKYELEGEPVESEVEGTIDGWKEQVSSYANGVAFVANAGELSSIIPNDEKYTITTLKISGDLNGSDFRLIRAMAGVDYDDNNNIINTEGKLKNLDLLDANIVEGGEAYFKSAGKLYYTQNDVLSDFLFSYSSVIQTLVLPKSVVGIGNMVFASCLSLTSLNIPNSVLYIGNSTFQACQSLAMIEIPSSVNSIGESAFAGCYSLTSVTIPNSVTSIGMTAFYDCKNLESIDLPNNITSIPSAIFFECTSLTSVTIPNSVTLIKANAFGGCSSLASINIPSGVTQIEDYAFGGCSSLVECYCYVNIPTRLTLDKNWGTFEGISEDAKLFVPSGSGSAYRTSDWAQFFDEINIIEMN